MSAQSQTAIPQPSQARSMTGFARVRRSVGDSEIVVSIKSLNHRSLDLHFQIPSELDPIEQDMRSAVRRRLSRGHVEVRVGLSRTGPGGGLALNRTMLSAYLRAFRDAAAEIGSDERPDLNVALRTPGILTESGQDEPAPSLRAAILETIEEALDGLDQFRRREGGEIAAAMLRHNEAIRGAAEELAEIRSRALPLFQARLNDRLKELLKGINVDPQRLAQEAAIMADRSDVAEEISRLQIHSEQLRELITGGGEVGKKLDFLLQEMNREANTVLSKTTGIGEAGLRITDLALAAKANIEKIREQSLNLE